VFIASIVGLSGDGVAAIFSMCGICLS
jgi:hypothetical protein